MHTQRLVFKRFFFQKGISKAKAKSGKGASPPPDRNAATAPTPREEGEEGGTELDPSVFTCEREEMPNIHCNIWSGDEGREDCPKGIGIGFFIHLCIRACRIRLRMLPRQVRPRARVRLLRGVPLWRMREPGEFYIHFFIPSHFLKKIIHSG